MADLAPLCVRTNRDVTPAVTEFLYVDLFRAADRDPFEREKLNLPYISIPDTILAHIRDKMNPLLDLLLKNYDTWDDLINMDHPPTSMVVRGIKSNLKSITEEMGVSKLRYDSDIKNWRYEISYREGMLYRSVVQQKQAQYAGCPEDCTVRSHHMGYLLSLNPSYLSEVRQLAKTVPPINSGTKLSIAIPVAADQEHGSIRKTLEEIARQTLDPGEYEVSLFLNLRRDDDGNLSRADVCSVEIEAFMKEHPEMQVHVMRGSLPAEDSNIGLIRKLQSDVLVARQLEVDGDRDLLLHRLDADTEGIHPQLLEQVVQEFEKNPDLMAARGQIDFDPAAYSRSPRLYIEERAGRFFYRTMARQFGFLEMGCPNFTVKSSIYAAVGGYNAAHTVGEDVQLSQKICSYAREQFGTSEGRIAVLGFQSRIFTSSRRAGYAAAQGVSSYEQWSAEESKFSLDNPEIRGYKVDRQPYQNLPDDPQECREYVEEVLNNCFQNLTDLAKRDHMGQDIELKGREWAEVYLRPLGHIGIEARYVHPFYRRDKPVTRSPIGKIKIKDMSRFLESYKANRKVLEEIASRRVLKVDGWSPASVTSI